MKAGHRRDAPADIEILVDVGLPQQLLHIEGRQPDLLPGLVEIAHPRVIRVIRDITQLWIKLVWRKEGRKTYENPV